MIARPFDVRALKVLTDLTVSDHLSTIFSQAQVLNSQKTQHFDTSAQYIMQIIYYTIYYSIIKYYNNIYNNIYNI